MTEINVLCTKFYHFQAGTRQWKLYRTKLIYYHNILEPTTGVTFFNSGFKSDPTELFPSIVQVIAG
jgi:hypothetical protein